MTSIRHDGPTPAGGSYSEAICDGDGRLVEIVEFDEEGMIVARTYATGISAPPRR